MVPDEQAVLLQNLAHCHRALQKLVSTLTRHIMAMSTDLQALANSFLSRTMRLFNANR